MPTEQELQAFFHARAQRTEELRAQYKAGWPATLSAFGVGCLIPIGLMCVFLAVKDTWWEHPYYRAGVTAAIVLALASAVLGHLLYARGQKLFEPVDAAVNDELLRPFVDLLVPGAVLEFPGNSILEWRASLLFTKDAHVYDIDGKISRIRGRLAGIPAVLDELLIRYQHLKMSDMFGGWVVHCALPFEVAGHLRIRVAKRGYDDLYWQKGFEPLADATARLGTGYEIAAAAPGVTPEGAEAPTSGGVPVEALLTDALFEQLRGAGKLQLAATGRNLWILVPRMRAFCARRNVAAFDADYGRKTAERVALVEAIVAEVVRAGGGASR